MNATSPVADPNDLITFTRVVDAGSFSAAARELGVPTSTVSRRVARLEAQLDVRLLQRSTRRLHLTDAGRILHARGARIAAELADAGRAVSEMQSTPRGTVRLTAPTAVGELLTPLLAELLDRHPELGVDLDLTDRVVDIIEEGFDLALRGGPLRDSSLVAHRVSEAPVHLVASPAYLERRGTPRRYQELAEHDCILFAPWSERSTWTLLCPEGKVRVRVRGRLQANSVRVVREAALAGLGIALFPTLAYHRADLDAGRLRIVLPDVGVPAQTLWLVYPSRRLLAPKVRAVVEHVRERFDEILTGPRAGGKARPVRRVRRATIPG